MAARTTKKSGAALERLRADLKAGSPANVYIFYGEETYLRDRYLEELRQLLVPAGFEEFNYHRLPGKGLTVQDLTETVEAMPMMAQHTLVVVTDMDLFRLDEGQRGLLIELLGDFPEYCTLVFVYDVLAYKRDGKMKKLCAAIGDHVQEVEFCQQEREQLLRWMKRRFAAEGHDIDIAAADHLLFTCGTLMTDLRIGHGYDVHRLTEGRKLILGGVEIPYEKGLLGHSDADVLVHAVMDALTGAARLGDIGKLFPDTDPAYAGISSLKLLAEVGRLLAETGRAVVNIDATLLAQAPKVGPYRQQMAENIAMALHIDPERVNVKATTEEGLGFTGDGSGMAAHAVALIETVK